MTTTTPLVDRIDAELAQTQCRECGYPSCRDYADAIAAGDSIAKCRPGGDEVIVRLAALLERAVVPPVAPPLPARVAWIAADRCIGCARCLPPCPVDAIVGFAPYLHTVLAAECTGCGLCVDPCPVDCIELRLLADASAPPAPARAASNRWRARFDAHVARDRARAAVHDSARADRLARRRASRASPPSTTE